MDAKMIWTVAFGLAIVLVANVGQTAGPIYDIRRPLRWKGNFLVEPLSKFDTDDVDKDNIWMLMPWKLGKTVTFPWSETEEPKTQPPKQTLSKGKRIFIASYPFKLQGGELQGFAMAEKTCRESGKVYLGDENFRALLTSNKRPLNKILPRHHYNYNLLNLHGDLLSANWSEFVRGRLANNSLISMDGTKDSILPRFNWKYYWLGDGYGRTCLQWASSFMMDFANVLAFDYANNAVVHDVASCSANLNLLCYSVSDNRDHLL